jgi:NAD-dependent dihydropyrimidine dehydrogenase PreA subunit
MIELVSQSRCVSCNLCVEVCPTNVFDIQPGEAPTLARQEDCQTCFLCEAYCPADALFVAANAHERVVVDEEELIAKGLLGQYRRNLGWGRGRNPGDELKKLHQLRMELNAVRG